MSRVFHNHIVDVNGMVVSQVTLTKFGITGFRPEIIIRGA
jgi:hypothetical protein